MVLSSWTGTTTSLRRSIGICGRDSPKTHHTGRSAFTMSCAVEAGPDWVEILKKY